MTEGRVTSPTRIEVQACRDCGAPVFWTEWPGATCRHIFDVRTLAFDGRKLTMQSHTLTCPSGARRARQPKKD